MHKLSAKLVQPQSVAWTAIASAYVNIHSQSGMLCKLHLTVADSIVNCISQGYKPGLIIIYVNVKHK